MFQILGKTNINFLGQRRWTFLLSALLVALGLFALIRITTGRANLGIDFVGGMALQLKFERPVVLDEIRDLFGRHGFGEAELQASADGTKLFIRVRRGAALDEQVAAQLQDLLATEQPDHPFVVEGLTEIGPKIGKKLRHDALLAVVLAMVGVLLYIALRFEWLFGVAAALTTIHDVLIVLGIFYLLDKELTLLVISALLALAGYSLTDTVVVFDRIRERLRTRHRELVEPAINRALNEVLSRTVITSVTTLMATLALFFLGGEVLHDFALALSLGIIVGTYSSIFVASPLLVVWPRGTGRLLRHS